MKRNAKAIQEKASKCKVYITRDPRKFDVLSPSGETYTVTAMTSGGFRCVCEWAGWYDTEYRPCAHASAVDNWLAEAAGRKLALWASPEDAERQHRPTERVGLGMWSTSRKVNIPAGETEEYIAASYDGREYWCQRRERDIALTPTDGDKRLGGVLRIARKSPMGLLSALRALGHRQPLYVKVGRHWIYTG